MALSTFPLQGTPGVEYPPTFTWGDPSSTCVMDACPWCGFLHPTGLVCPRVKVIEYHPDGRIKRVEFWPEQPFVNGAWAPDINTQVVTGCTGVVND